MGLLDGPPDALANPKDMHYVVGANAAIAVGMSGDGRPDQPMIVLDVRAEPADSEEVISRLFALDHDGALFVAELLIGQARIFRGAVAETARQPE